MAAAKRKAGRPASTATLITRAVQSALETATAKPSIARSTQARYDAAGQGRRMAGWNPPRTSPNTAMVGVDRIRERARDSSRNDWAGASGTQKWGTALVGIGITPRWNRIKSLKRRQQVVDKFLDWSAVADADGIYDYHGLITLAVRTWFDGGECFGRLRRRFSDDTRYPLPMQVQLLEADMVPFLDSTARQGLPVGNEIKSGIEFDKRGQRVAYWVYKNHPGDKFVAYNGEELVRVAASEMLHMFEPKRPGQIRGVSEAAPILARLRNIADYDDAVLERQKIANLFVAFIKRELPDFDLAAADKDPLSNELLDAVTDFGEPLLPMQPGLMQELGTGEDVQFSNPPEAGTTYTDYMRTQNMGTSAGMGLPYELHSGDILNISDRTLRILVNEFRRHAEQRQWQIVIPMFCQRVIDWVAASMVISGFAAVSEFDDVRRVEHTPHGWPDIHPTQDIEGRVNEIKNGLRSQSEVISRRGDDPEVVALQQQADDRRNKRLKIGPYSEAAQMALAPKAAPKDGEPPEPQDPDSAGDAQ